MAFIQKIFTALFFAQVCVHAQRNYPSDEYFGPGNIQEILGAPTNQGRGAQVQCRRQEVSPGRFKFNCEGANPRDIAVRSEHILWLAGPAGQKQVVDIEVPNYKIQELIKAGFKTSPGEGTLINVLLRRPQQSYDAQVEKVPPAGGIPTVNLQYEKPVNTLVHFPNDKPYSTLVGRIEPPLNPGRGNIDIRTGGQPNFRLA